MSAPDKPENPHRYKENAQVFHIEHGWGRTFNPRVGSNLVEVKLDGDEKIISVHEDELRWVISYPDRCVAFGSKLATNGGFFWFYSPNDQLGGRSPKQAVEEEDLDLVEEVHARTFNTQNHQ